MFIFRSRLQEKLLIQQFRMDNFQDPPPKPIRLPTRVMTSQALPNGQKENLLSNIGLWRQIQRFVRFIYVIYFFQELKH